MVLSPRAYNGRVGLALLCPITRQAKGYPFEVLIPPGIAIEGVILADQIRSLDWRTRNAEVVASLPADSIDEVLEKMGLLLARDSR